MIQNIFIGDKFYRFIGEQLDLIRVIKIKNDNCFVVRDSSNNCKKVNKEYFNDFIKIKADCRLMFSIVNLQDKNKDVIITMIRRSDIENGISVPYAVCRQSIINIYADAVRLPHDNNIYVGLSANVDNCPADVDFRMLLCCNGVEYTCTISCYMDDKLNDILELVNKMTRFDDVLKNLRNQANRYNTVGYVNSVKSLLEENDFMFDFLKGFNIDKVPFKVSINEDASLDREQTIYLEDLIKQEMFRTYVIKYDKDININKIEREHIIVSDKDEDIYIIAYDKGEYINRAYKDSITDKRDAILMLKKQLNFSKQK